MKSIVDFKASAFFAYAILSLLLNYAFNKNEFIVKCRVNDFLKFKAAVGTDSVQQNLLCVGCRLELL